MRAPRRFWWGEGVSRGSNGPRQREAGRRRFMMSTVLVRMQTDDGCKPFRPQRIEHPLLFRPIYICAVHLAHELEWSSLLHLCISSREYSTTVVHRASAWLPDHVLFLFFSSMKRFEPHDRLGRFYRTSNSFSFIFKFNERVSV